MLIAYFSHTGNTALVAGRIHALAGGTLHRIRTVASYPQEHDLCSRLAGQELSADARPALAAGVENLARCPVVFLGYPIWWHTMPMACRTFLESGDFSGKTIIPFCTSGSDGFADSLRDIAGLCPEARILEGYHTSDAHSGGMPVEVSDWLQRLGVKV